MTGPESVTPVAQTLLTLRQKTGLSQREAARQAGLAHARLGRMERGSRLPTEDDIRALCRLYRAESATRLNLLATVKELRAEPVAARTVLQRGAGPYLQHRIRRMEASASLIRAFQPAIVLGLLQTPAYIRALVAYAGDDEDELDRFVAARLERQAALHERRWELVLTEGALRWNVGSPTVMAEQLDHLIAVTELPTVRLGVIPWTRSVHRHVRHGFTILDDQAVRVATETASATHTEQADIESYVELFAAYSALADYDDAARAVFARLAAEYRAL